jgi:hypothetical protein
MNWSARCGVPLFTEAGGCQVWITEPVTST